MNNQNNKIWVVIGGSVLLLIIMVVTILLLSAGSKNSKNPALSKRQGIQPEAQAQSNDHPAQSPEVQKAVAEQMKVDQEYAGWQTATAAEYPWLKKLPLTSTKYYVYFDLGKRVFMGRIYPTAGDNVDLIKNEIIADLRDNKKVSSQLLVFEWTVSPL